MTPAATLDAPAISSPVEELEDVEAAIESAETESYFRRETVRAARGRIPGEALDETQARLVSEAFGEHPVTGERYYAPEEVKRWLAHAAELGAARPSVGAHTLLKLYRREVVPNGLLRERFLELHELGKLTAVELAKRLGYVRKGSPASQRRSPVGDATRVERDLGLATVPGSNGRPPSLRLFIPYDLAVRLADLLEVSYHDCGV